MERVDEAVQQGLERAGRTGDRADQWGVARSVEDGVGVSSGGAIASWGNGRMVGGEMVWNTGHAVGQCPANATGQTGGSESEVGGFGSMRGLGVPQQRLRVSLRESVERLGSGLAAQPPHHRKVFAGVWGQQAPMWRGKFFPQPGSANYRYLSTKKNYRIRGVPFHRPEEIKSVPFHRPWGVPFHRGKLPESRDFSTVAARQSVRR